MKKPRSTPWPLRLALWTPAVLVAAAIFYLSSQSVLPAAVHAPDLLAHAVVYTVLGLVSLRAFHGGLHPLRWRPTLAALAFTIAYGASDELHQSFVPGRTPSVLDLGADAVGALVAMGLVAAWFTLRPRVSPATE
jgi:VanZ family protein